MIKFEKLGVILSAADRLHSKFNTGAYFDGETVHLLYRWGEIPEETGGSNPVYIQNYISYAKMTPEGKVFFDYEKPIFKRTHQWEKKGLEDPRIFRLDGKNYITYTAWDGKQARVAFASSNDDFTEFEKIGIVPAKKFDKDAFLFPERIGGKLAYVHRFEPNIQIDYFDSIDDLFDEEFWNNYEPDLGGSVALAPEQKWESGKLGGSVPPIRTELGWLFIYHGVTYGANSFCYRGGIALLDGNDPHKILARLPYPVLEPTEDYELRGDVNNVVFPCGGYCYNGYLYIVYGGADKVTCLARCPMKDIIDEFAKILKN